MKSKPISNWAALLSQEVSSREKKPKGDGWLTLVQLAEDEGVSVSSLKRQMKRLLDKGIVETFTGSELNCGRLSRQVWWRQKKGSK
jgi:hypothetical protein